MRNRQSPFHFEDVQVAALREGRHAGALQAMVEQRADGLIVRGLFTAEECARAIERIGRMSPPRVEFGGPELAEPAALLGLPIVGADAALTAYLADGAQQRERVRQMFAESGFEARVGAAFSGLAGGLPVQVAHALDGRTCPPATVRVLPEGGEVGIHVGNDFVNMPAAEQLRVLLDTTTQLSYFVTLAAPAAGGELVVYDLEWGAARLFMAQPEVGKANLWYEGTPQFRFFATRASSSFAPGVGDLLVFDGGRYFHRVSKVRGASPRWTIGGFLGLSRARDRVYFWS